MYLPHQLNSTQPNQSNSSQTQQCLVSDVLRKFPIHFLFPSAPQKILFHSPSPSFPSLFALLILRLLQNLQDKNVRADRADVDDAVAAGRAASQLLLGGASAAREDCKTVVSFLLSMIPEVY